MSEYGIAMVTCYQRVMLPDDANPAGNVHGGTIMKMIEQAGYICALRHLKNAPVKNNNDGDETGSEQPSKKMRGIPKFFAAMARLEHMDFLLPMKIGDLAVLSAAVTFASSHSLEVHVKVEREQLDSDNTICVTNRATLWYVVVETPVVGTSRLKALSCPPVEISEEARKAGEARYTRQVDSRKAAKQDRSLTPLNAEKLAELDARKSLPGALGSDISRSQLMQLMLPSDCTISNVVMGGVVMKIVDNAAGACAVRHCRTNVVTACIDDVDFRMPVWNGDLLIVTATMRFTSTKSMEIHVTVEAESMRTEKRSTAGTARLTFVSLDKNGKCIAVPPLAPSTDEEKHIWAEAETRYMKRRQQRAAAIKK